MATHILLKNNTMPTDNRPTLAIDTSTSFLSIALEHQGEIRLFHENVGTKQSEQILPQIERLFKEAGITAADLGCIVYAQGPGAFTGLRIGAAVAQGLATPFDTPMIGIPCLDAAASLLPPSSCILAATDARMGEVFYAWFDTQNHVRLSKTPSGGIGNAFALADKPPFDGQADMPTAADYLKLARSGRYVATDAAHAELLYVRNKIALTAQEQAQQKAKP